MFCPVAILKAYEDATKKWRSPDMKPNCLLFLSPNKPHKSVTSASIAQGIKKLLADVGVDTDKIFAELAAGLSTADIEDGWLRQ